MAYSRTPGPMGCRTQGRACPRTPGPLGINDHSDPNVFSLRGDTPPSLGRQDLLGFRIGSLEELRFFIMGTPDFTQVEQAVLELLGTLPHTLIDGDFT